MTVDGIPVANLDLKMSSASGLLEYQINSLTNVTELYTGGFNLTLPDVTPVIQAMSQVHGVQEVMAGGFF